MDLSQYSIGDVIGRINARLAAKGITGPKAAQIRGALLSKLAEQNSGVGGPADPAIADHAAGEQQRAELAQAQRFAQPAGPATGPLSNVYQPILNAVGQAAYANAPDETDQNSFAGDMGRSFVRGALGGNPGNMMRTAGSLLGIDSLEQGGAALSGVSQSILRNDPALRTKQGGGFVRDVVMAATESSHNLGMQMALGSVGGPLGFAVSAAGPVFADTYAEGLQAHGDGNRALEEAAGAAAVTAATSWAQGKFLKVGGANAAPALVQGMKPLLTKAAKEYVLRFGEGALGEALQNEAEELGTRYLREYVRGDQEAWKGWLEEMPVRAAAAGLAGGATDSAGLPQSFTTSRERRGSELARLAYVAQREEQAARKKGDAVVAQAKRAEKLALMRQAEEVLGLNQQTAPEAPAGTEDTTDEGLTDFEREAEQRAAGGAPAAPAAPKAPAKTVQTNMAPGWDQNPMRGADNLDRTPEQLDAQAKQLTAKAMALSKAGKTEESVAAWEAVKRIDEARKAMTTPTTTAGPGDADDIGARLQQALSAETMKSLQRDAEAEAKRLEVNADADAVLADPNADPMARLLAMALRTEDPAPRGGAPTARSAAGDVASAKVGQRVLQVDPLAFLTGTTGSGNAGTLTSNRGTNAQGMTPTPGAVSAGIHNEEPSNGQVETQGWQAEGLLNTDQAPSGGAIETQPPAPGAGGLSFTPGGGLAKLGGKQMVIGDTTVDVIASPDDPKIGFITGLKGKDVAGKLDQIVAALRAEGFTDVQYRADAEDGRDKARIRLFEMLRARVVQATKPAAVWTDDQSPDAGNVATEPETQDQPAGYTRRPEREADIEKMVQAASKPMPDIVESSRLEGTDGNWYGPNGFPTGVTMTGKRRVDGYVYQSKDGKTGNQLFESREAAQQAWTDKQAEESEDFRRTMHEREDGDFASARDYWIGKPEQGFQGELVDRAMAVFIDHVPEKDKGKFSLTTLRTKTIPYILTAITTGNFNDMLRPDNGTSRKTFETLTGVKLPPSLSKTQAMFTGKPFDILPETKEDTKPKGDTKKDEHALGTDKNIGKRGSWEIVDGMIRVTFPSKPDTSILDRLRRDGFTWGGKKRPYWSAKATDTNKETADAAIGPAPAKKVGKNAKGQDVYEDGYGVRSYAEGGLLVSETVNLTPTRGGISTGVDKSKRGPEFKTTEELAAENVDQQKKSEDAAADQRKLVEIGQKAVPGVRLTDADEAGRMYLMWGKGDITESEWNAYVADLYASGKAKKPEADDGEGSAAQAAMLRKQITVLEETTIPGLLSSVLKGNVASMPPELATKRAIASRDDLDKKRAQLAKMEGAPSIESLESPGVAVQSYRIGDVVLVDGDTELSVVTQTHAHGALTVAKPSDWVKSNVNAGGRRITLKVNGANVRQIGRAGAMSDAHEAPKAAQPPKDDAAPKPAGVLSPEREARKKELEKRLRDKIQNRLQTGFDPVMLAEATELASIYIEEGARKFAAFARQMVGSLGDTVRPYLKSLYNGARDLPGMEEYAEQMDPAAAVSKMTLKEIEDAILKEVALENEGRDGRDAPGSEPVLPGSAGADPGNAVAGDQDAGDGQSATDGSPASNGQPPRTGGNEGDASGGNKAGGRRGGTRGGTRGGKPGGVQPKTDADGKPVAPGPVGEDPKVQDLDAPAAKDVRDMNHRISASDTIAPTNREDRIKGNIKAIRILKALEKEDRNPTPEEKKSLARYVGFGPISEVVNRLRAEVWERYLERTAAGSGYVYEPDDEVKAWAKNYYEDYKAIRELVTRAEFEAMTKSTRNAHYTGKNIIERGIWPAVKRLGFTGGNVLETSAGIGHMIGLMPEDLVGTSKWTAVEMDSISSRILAKLYPQANVLSSSFQDAPLKKHVFDLIVGNVPFAKDIQKTDEGYPDFSLHNYFLAKSIDMLRPGGLMVVISSISSMDADASRTWREWMAERANLVGAIRLPNNAFIGAANTAVTTDIMIFRKKQHGYPLETVQDFAYTVQLDTKETGKNGGKLDPIPLNVYYQNNPSMLLGTMSAMGEMYGGIAEDKSEPTMKPFPGDKKDGLNARLDAAVASLPSNILTLSGRETTDVVDAAPGTRMYSLFTDASGNVMQRRPDGSKILRGAEATAAKAFMGLRDAMAGVVSRQVSEDASEADIELARKQLKEQYETFVEKYGRINEKKSSIPESVEDDPDFNKVAALEMVTYKGVQRGTTKKGKPRYVLLPIITPADILTKRTQWPFKEPETADSPRDAIAISEFFRGSLNLPYVAKLIGKSEADARKAMLAERLVFLDPSSGELVPSAAYLSGNVKNKLAEAERAAGTDATYSLNVEALTPLIPEAKPISKINIRMGATWIPAKAYTEFVESLFGKGTVSIVKTSTGQWSVKVNEYAVDSDGRVNLDKYGKHEFSALTIIKHILEVEPLIAYDKVITDSGKESTRKNPERSADAESMANTIREKFLEWAKTGDSASSIADAYNAKYNASIPRKYDPPPYKHFPGASQAIVLRDYQKRGVMRGIAGSYLNAAEVGLGKTFIGITVAMEWRRLKQARKPLLVVQPATLMQVATSFNQLYPTASVLVPTEAERKRENWPRLINRITTGDWDCIVIPQTLFNNIRTSPEFAEAFIHGEIDALTSAAADAVENEGKRSTTAKKLQEQIDALEKYLDSIKKAAREEKGALFLDQLGIDGLIVDEAHDYKNSYFRTAYTQLKGVNPNASGRALDMLLKTKYVQQRVGMARNIVLMTGTPVSNTIGEAWVMMRYVRPDLLEANNLANFDDFAGAFADISAKEEMDSTNRFKPQLRMRAFTNTKEFQSIWLDVVESVRYDNLSEAERKTINRPSIKGGKPTMIELQPTKDTLKIMRKLIAKYEWFEKLKGKERFKNRHVPGVINTMARKASIDSRMINADLADDPGSKVNRLVSEVFERWKSGADAQTSQVIFSDLYRDDPDNPRFNVFEDIQAKLIAMGVPASEIVIATDLTDAGRAAVFERVNSGACRVIMGTTQKLGIGVNIQQRLAALHHLDAPYRPMDMEQREGRIIRFGNLIFTLIGSDPEILRYGVTKTFDAGQYGRLERKQRAVNDTLAGNAVDDTVEGAGEETALSFAEASAAFSGDPDVMLKVELDGQVRRLENVRNSFLDAREASVRRIEAYRDRARHNREESAKAAEWIEKHGRTLDVDTAEYVVPGTEGTLTGEDATKALNQWFADTIKRSKERGESGTSPRIREGAGTLYINGVRFETTSYADMSGDDGYVAQNSGISASMAELSRMGTNYYRTAKGLLAVIKENWDEVAARVEYGANNAATNEAEAVKAEQALAKLKFDQQDELDAVRAEREKVMARLRQKKEQEQTAGDDDVDPDDPHAGGVDLDDVIRNSADSDGSPADKWYVAQSGGEFIENGAATALPMNVPGLDPTIEFFTVKGRGRNAVNKIYESSTGQGVIEYGDDPVATLKGLLDRIGVKAFEARVIQIRASGGTTPRHKAKLEGGSGDAPRLSASKRSPKAATERASKLDAADADLARLSTGTTMRAAEPANDLDREYDRFLKRLGLNPVWFTSPDDGLEGAVASRRDKNVYLHAGMDTDRAMAVPLHELLHKMRDLNPELFELLKKAAGPARIDAAIAAYRARLVAFAGPKSDFVRDFDASRDRQIEEGLATVMESMATDPEIRAAILAKPSVWDRFKRWAKALLDKFGFGDGKSALRGAMLKAFDQMEKGGGPKPRGGGSDTRFSPAPAPAEESTPLPERRYLDAALVAATKAVRGASRRGKRLADVVEAYAAQLEKQSGHSVDRAILTKITKAWLRNLPTVTKDAMEQLESRYATATKEADEPATKKEARERRKATSEAISEAVATLTAKTDRNVSERAALAGKLKGMERTADQIGSDAVRAMKQAHRQGKQVGAAAARAQGALALNRAIDALRMERTAHRMAQRSADAEGKVRNKLEYEGKIKAAVIRIADEMPMRIKGKLIPAIKSAKNVKHIVRAINRAKFEISRMGARDDMRIMARLAKRWGRSLNDDNRFKANQAMTGAIAAYKALRDIKVPAIKGHSTLIGDPATDAAETHATTISKALADMKQAVNEQRMEDANVQITRKLGTDDVRRDLMEGLNKQKELPQADVPSGNNPGAVRNFFRKYWNVRSLIMKIDGKADTGAAMSLFQRMKRAQRRHLADKHQFEDVAERITRAQGYSSVAEFMAEVSGTLGTQGQKVVEARLQIYDTAKKAWETRKQKITLGQALYILASDPQTQHWAHRGTEFVFDDGKTTRFKIPDRTWGELERAVPVRALRAMKALKKEYDRQYFNGLNDVSKTLNGRYLDKVQDYWGVRRHRVDDELDGSQAMRNAIPALEAAGILQDRSGGRDPIIVGDFGTEIFRRSEAASHIVHKAKEIHILRATLLSRPVLEKIARVYGDKIKDRLVATVQEFAGKKIEADSLGKIVGNINRSKVQLWVPTWLRNMGSIARLISVMSITDIAAGFAQWAKSPVETYRTLLKHSPELRERWNGSAGTMSFAMPGATTATHAGARKALVATMKQLASTLEPLLRMNFPEFRRRLASVDKPWTEMLDSLSMGNVFDSAAAGVAYHASKRRGMSDRVAAMAATEMFENVANTNTVLESTGMQQEAKGSLWRSMLMSFTSDIAKAQNLIIQARMRGPKDLAKALAGILASIAFSASVTYAWNRLRGDEADTALEATQTRLVKDLVSIVPLGNTIGAPVVDKMMSGQWGLGAAMDTPIQGTATNLVSAMHDVYMGYKAHSEEDLYTASEKYQSALTRAAGVTGDVIGLPISGYTNLLKKVEKNYE